MEAQKVHYNKPQLLAKLIDAKDEVDIWGRGTGKSQGRGSVRALDMATMMPRCSFVNVANTYMQLLDRTLPPMISHWEELGMKRDVDFWVRRFPSKEYRFEMPIITPEVADHCIFIRANKKAVSVMRLVSQDRPASSSGISIDGIMGDEARYLSWQKLQDELMPTNRGNERFFKGCHLHHGTLWMSDMPRTAESLWLLEEEKKMDKEAVEIVKQIQFQLFRLNLKIQKQGGKTKSDEFKLGQYNKMLFEIRKELLFYSEASTLQNIDVVGIDYIKRMHRQLSPAEYNRAILNLRPDTVEDAFYAHLSDKHTYTAYHSHILEGLKEEEWGKGHLDNCKKDSDLIHSIPLSVAPDFGGSINCLVVGQRSGRDFLFQKNIYVKNPGRVKDLAAEFDRYYRYFYKKEVVFYYDHTHYQTNPNSDLTPKDEFISQLEARGWIVYPKFIGHTPSPYSRYHLWGLGLVGDDPKILLPKFNKYNTDELRNSMSLTAIKKGGKTGYEKDKSLERDKQKDQLNAPHLSDAADVLYWGEMQAYLADSEIAADIYLI